MPAEGARPQGRASSSILDSSRCGQRDRGAPRRPVPGALQARWKAAGCLSQSTLSQDVPGGRRGRRCGENVQRPPRSHQAAVPGAGACVIAVQRAQEMEGVEAPGMITAAGHAAPENAAAPGAGCSCAAAACPGSRAPWRLRRRWPAAARAPRYRPSCSHGVLPCYAPTVRLGFPVHADAPNQCDLLCNILSGGREHCPVVALGAGG